MIIIALGLIAAWVAPYFILGQDAHMRIQDNLDSNLAWYKVLNDSGELFGSLHAHIPQIMNGHLSRDAFYSQFYGIVLLFTAFPPMVAYGLSQAVTRFFAFFGMYLLLKKYVIKEAGTGQGLIRVGAAVTFALTPYWPSGMLSIMGMPLALWAFLNIRRGEKSWKNWLTITLLPFYSSFMLGFFFFLSAMGIWWLVDLIRTKKWHLRWLLSIAYMTAIYLAIEYRLVASFLMPHEPTNRSEFYESKNRLIETLGLILKNYVIGHNQDQAVFGIVIFPLSIFVLILIIKQKQWRENKLFIGLHILNFLLSVWYAFWFYQGWEPLKERIDILTIFNFSRYHYIRPMIIYMLFALSVYILWKMGKKWRRIVVLCILAQFLALVPFNEQIAYHNEPSYKQFFAQKEFTEIKNYIGKPVDKYRVVSIGIHPDIAQYNGFYTLDTYNNFYPLSYKHRFRKIIAPELAKNKRLRRYFDDWGGRCYVFVDELGKHYMYSKRSNKKIKNLDLHTNVLKKMGGEYVLSAVPILNAEENQLSLQKVFETKDSYWRIYLYRVR
jgi:hypothetical protein